MMERYDTRGYKCGGPSNNDCMEKDPEGDYVLYSDAEAIERELAIWQDDWLKECQENDRLRAALAAAQGEVERLKKTINRAYTVGHNDDCLFCGFKDKELLSVLARQGSRSRLEGRESMNEANYASLEASKRLVEAGIVLETDFWWIRERSAWKLADNDYGLPRAFAIPAPSMAEVWRELPERSYFTKYNGHYQAWSEWTTFEGHGDSSPVKENTNPADALIDLLIWVRKEANHEST